MYVHGIIISQLKALPSAGFENLIYDLVLASGLRNAVWRTPGPDGGRDIEGEFLTVDFSGHHTMTKWYIECKRYSNALDWPTVWEKIAYGDNHRADYLLIVTTTHLSPQCKSEISLWNTNRRRPVVRSWDEGNLEQVLLRFPVVLLKHGLSDDERAIPPSFLSLASQTSKVVQSAYGAAEIAGYNDAALDAASALSELVTVRMGDIEAHYGYVRYPLNPVDDLYDWLQIKGDAANLRHFDRYGLRAFLALVRHVWSVLNLTLASTGPGALRLSFEKEGWPNVAAERFLAEVAIWGDLEMRWEKTDLVVESRIRP